MKRNIFLLTSLLMVALLFTACAPKSQVNDAPDAGSTTSHGGPVEDYVSLVDALRAAGAEVEPGESIEQPFFSVTGRILEVDGADVQVFEYESAEAMETDASQVAPDGGSIGTSMVSWIATPHFFKAGRLLVLYVGDDAAILDLLKSALGEQFAGR
jgi:hypothetical protein